MSEEIQDAERLDLPSGSKMELIVACPGQHRLALNPPPGLIVEDVKSAEEKEWADRGTKIHKAFQTGQTLLLDSEELATYQAGLQHKEKILQKWIADKQLDPAKVQEGPRELRVWLHKPYDWPELMGSAMTDAHYFYRDETRFCLLVLDLKSGWNPNLPPPAKSWQLKYELISLWKEEYEGVTDGRVAYVKAKEKCDVNDFCDYEMQDLQYSFDAIAYHSWFSLQPDAPRHAGLHCRWCPCKTYCPEALAYALLPSVMAGGVFSSKKVPENVEKIIPMDLYRIWEAGSVVKKIIEEVTGRIKKMTDEERRDIGLELGKGRETHDITLVMEAMQFLRDKKGWDQEQIWQALVFVNGRLAEVAGRLHGLSDDEATDWVKKTLAEFITISTSDRPIKKLK